MVPETFSEEELLECTIRYLQNNCVKDKDDTSLHKTDQYVKSLVKAYTEGDFHFLEQEMSTKHATELVAMLFERERNAHIRIHFPEYTGCSVNNLVSDESVTIESLFGDIPQSLFTEPKTVPEKAGLGAFVYRMEHSTTGDQVETVEEKFPDLVEALRENQVVLLQGDTGCGKTTKVPRMLLAHYKQIACTQPRRLAAVNVARKVAADLGEQVGGLVGYSVRFEERRSKKTRLHFLTDGMLIKEISGFLGRSRGVQSDGARPTSDNTNPQHKNATATFSKYNLIIVDEAHERNINIDFLMGFLKSQSFCKLLVMSATLDTECFVSYFNAPLVEIKHRMYPISHYYLKEPIEDYLNAAIETVVKIVDEYEEGDILVFLTGQDEIEQGYEILMGEFGESINICKLYSAMPPEEQDKAFKPGRRKVVLSTNIAETSVTIENIRFVVDSGRVKQKRRGSGCSIDFMEVVKISKSQAGQRAGRSGRTGPGMVYRLYTRWEYEDMQERSTPEILRSSLNSVILALKGMHVHDVVNFEYLDRPSIEAISESLRALYYMRAIDADGKITPLGIELTRSPFDPQMALAVRVARNNGGLEAVATIAAFLSVGQVFVEPRVKDKAYKAVRKEQLHPKGDFYTFLKVYEEWHRSKFSSKFCKDNYLRRTAMETVLHVKMQILNSGSKRPYYQVKQAAMALAPIKIDEGLEAKIMEAFCSGYFMNIAKKDNKSYFTVFGNTVCYLHTKDPLFKKNPKYVLFHELICTRKEIMRGCLEVTSKMLHYACNKPENNKNLVRKGKGVF